MVLTRFPSRNLLFELSLTRTVPTLPGSNIFFSPFLFNTVSRLEATSTVSEYPDRDLSLNRRAAPDRDLAFDVDFYDRSRGMSAARRSKGSIEKRSVAHARLEPTFQLRETSTAETDV